MIPGSGSWYANRSPGLKLALLMAAVTLALTGALYLLAHNLAGDYLVSRTRQDLLCAVREVIPRAGKFSSGRMLDAPALEADLKRFRPAGHEGLRVDYRLFAPEGGPAFPPTLPEELRPLAGTQQFWLEQSGPEGRQLVLVCPLPETGLYLAASTPLEGADGGLAGELAGWFLLTGCAMGLLAALFTFAVVRREVETPLDQLSLEVERMAGGDLTPPSPRAKGLGSILKLSAAISRMAATSESMLQTARSNQERFQQLFTENRDAAFIIDGQGRLEDINPAGLEMFGYESQQSILTLMDTRPLFQNQEVRQAYLAALEKNGFVQEYPVVMIRRDGSTFEGLITASRRRDKEGRFGLLRDVTQTRQAQRDLRRSEARYRRLVEKVPDIIYRWSPATGAFDYISPAVEEVTGFTQVEIMADNSLLLDNLHPLWKEKVISFWINQIKGLGPASQEQEFMVKNKAGEYYWLRERSHLVRDEEGRVLFLEGIATDITDSKKAERALRKGQQMVEATLQGLPAAIMVVDRTHRVVHWNRAMERLTGVESGAMVGSTRLWEPFYAEERPVLVDLVLNGDQEGLSRWYGGENLKPSELVEGGFEGETYFPSLGGRARHIYFLAAPIQDEDGKVVRAVETLIDLSDKRALEEELRRLSLTDPLTGLFNQRSFYANLEREMGVARRYGHPLSLIMMDLDNFKRFNDTYGHLEGDVCLKSFARCVEETVRATDFSCRYGGEEFTVILPHTGREEALAVAQRIRRAVKAMELTLRNAEGGETRDGVTVSLGLAAYQADMDLNELIRQSDEALYRAKRAGRDRVCIAEGGGYRVEEEH